MEGDPLLRTIARRVRWLDRYRRGIAVVVAGAVTVFGVVAPQVIFGTDWPPFHARLMALVGGVVLGCVIDVGLAALLAVWETKHDRLLHDRGLPRAELVRRR